MWKYLTKEQSNSFLLSLCLLDKKEGKEHIRTLYSISNQVEKNYKIYKIKKKNGKFRTIYEPNPTLKYIQSQILHHILYGRSVSEYATAYQRGRTCLENALPHVGKKVILKLDILNFFDSISFMQVYDACFSIAYFPKEIGMLLTYLCTYCGRLPQGAPTSPYISNLVMKEFDEILGKWCSEKGISYTRYSDDMTFSGDFFPSDVISYVRKLLFRLGLELNKDKIHVVRENRQQNVTGIVVNQKIHTSACYRKKIRQEIYYIKKYGLVSHLNRIDFQLSKDKYLNNLYGRILFVLQINSDDREFQSYQNYVWHLLKVVQLK